MLSWLILLLSLSTQALSPEDYRYVMNVVESAILSTDLAMYFKKRDKFLELIDNGEFDWQSEEKKERKLIVVLKEHFRESFQFFPFSSFHIHPLSALRNDDDSMRCKLI